MLKEHTEKILACSLSNSASGLCGAWGRKPEFVRRSGEGGQREKERYLTCRATGGAAETKDA
jgi:hypothetical protein